MRESVKRESVKRERRNRLVTYDPMRVAKWSSHVLNYDFPHVLTDANMKTQ